MPDLAEITLAFLRARITRIFPQQVRDCLAQLSEEQVWWRPNETSNSVGNLVIHLTGSLNHYLNRNVGGFPYDRDRDAEFAERKQIPKAELLAAFEDMIAKATQAFDALTPQRLTDPSPEPRMYTIVAEDLLAIVTHFSTHAGQLLWITKMLREGAIDDVWIRTHQELGGWGAKAKR
jgi:uncharacterized damage-inducible protein DinB